MLVMIRSHGRVYLLAGIVGNLNSPTVRADALTISSILSSIAILNTLVVPKHLAARFTDRTHSYRLTYSKTWTRQSARGLDLFRLAPDKTAALVSLSAPAKHTKTVTASSRPCTTVGYAWRPASCSTRPRRSAIATRPASPR